MKFKSVCWEPGIVHILTEKQAKSTGSFKQTLCGRVVPTMEDFSVEGSLRVCSRCRRVQDLVLRGHDPVRARDIVTGGPSRERKRGRHGGKQNGT